MNRRKAIALRVVLVVLLLGAVAGQILVPMAASSAGDRFREVAHLVVPYSVAAILAIACVQVALAAVWRLAVLRDRGALLSAGALRCLDAAAACGGVLTGLSAGVLVHVLAVVRLGGPGVVLGLAACVVVAMALVVLAVVLRSVVAARMG
ncbi:MAG: DUF2975 domain-containing protein [Bifidobacteriaceae bacterium]|jgi:hypothetical protein|nr:DUF2975 domain-containing protein [Bifidobacteriaceae bacterium]